MSSPVTGNDFVIASGGEDFCTRITRLLSFTSKLKLWFGWAFTNDGEAQNAIKTMFLPPPGVMFAYHSLSPAAAVKAEVEGWYRDPGDNGIPYWRLCDGTNGTPDLRGRVIVGVGQGSGLTERLPGSLFGSETHTLTSSETAFRQHFHGIGHHAPADGGDASGNQNDDCFLILRSWTSQQSWSFHDVHGDGRSDHGGTLTSGGLATTDAIDAQAAPSNASSAHNNMQPSMALYYIIRTSRLA